MDGTGHLERRRRLPEETDKDALLVTRRCRVRRFRPNDAQAALGYLGDREVMEFIEPPFDAAGVHRFIAWAGLRPEPLVYAVEDREAPDLLGHVVFHPWGDRDTWEIGWVLRRDVWGRGLATELTRALIAHGFGIPGVTRVIGECDPSNSASIRVMEKAGMVRSPALDVDLPVWAVEATSPCRRIPPRR